MKKFIILLAISMSANAQCFNDASGFIVCETQPMADFRNDYNSPKVYENGKFRGNLNGNQFDPNSVSNQFGRYGSKFSPDSINNPYRVK